MALGREIEGRQISDSRWEKIEGLLAGRPDSVSAAARAGRLSVKGVLLARRGGSDPRCSQGSTASGRAPSVPTPARTWAGIWRRVFQVSLGDPENRYVMIDSTSARTDQWARCGRGDKGETVGRRRGGLSAMLPMATGANEQPGAVLHMSAEAAERWAIPPLAGEMNGAVLADRW